MEENLNGIINVLKPPGMTSHDVIAFLRRLLQVKKAGHTGTLDPGVAGVLPVFLGKATKIIEFVPDTGKGYRAEVTFGRSTDTQDGFGQTLREADASFLTLEDVGRSLAAREGEGLQVPPMVSAVKLGGKKLYELARQGVEADRPARPVIFHRLAVVKGEGWGSPAPRVLFDIECSSGTYVRTLCDDIGKDLGCFGHMSFLVRTRSGAFSIADALLLQEIKDLFDSGSLQRSLVPMERVLPFPEVWVKDEAVRFVCHGNLIRRSNIEDILGQFPDNGLVKVIHRENGLLAVARAVESGFQPEKVLC